MYIADMHCDTISRIYDENAKKYGPAWTLGHNGGHLDLTRMAAGNYALQNFALFTQIKKVTDPFAHCMDLLSLFYREMEANRGRIRPVLTGTEIEKNMEEGKMSALLTIEEGAVCRGEIENLRRFYEKGVRMMTLTWNFENELASPNRIDWQTGVCTPETERGLKPRGIEFVEEMERLGMIVDVSHLGDAGIRDVLAHTRKPIAASHSNARAVCSHPRNLTDDMIRAIADRGGVIGINFCAAFLRDFAPGEERMSRISHMMEHLRHMKQVGGIGCIGLGTDFDGIDDELEIPGADSMQRFAGAMERAGFTVGEIEAVCYKNVLNFYRELLG